MEWSSVYQFFSSLWVVWLMLFFLALVVWVMRPRNKTRLESYGRIPLDDDPGNGNGVATGGAKGS